MVAPPTLLAKKIIAKDKINIANLMQTFEIFFSENTQQNCLKLHTNSSWVHVIKVCSNVVQIVLTISL